MCFHTRSSASDEYISNDFWSAAAARVINLRTLYAGISGPLITVGALQSANFLLYDSIRRTLHRKDHPHAADLDYLNHDSISNVALSALGTRTLMSVLTSPLFVVKTKQQVMTWRVQRTIRDTWRHGGRGFFVGFGPHFVNETIGRAVYFGTYEVAKRHLAKEGETASLSDRMIAACSSGIACWAVIFPFDVLRSRVYQRAILLDGNTGSAWDLSRSMYVHQGGLKPFYRGFGVTVLRAGPVAAAVLPVYDTTLEWLNKNN
jgi:solute carrier family 25 carnitine/acylcarnitine transporter 20/29